MLRIKEYGLTFYNTILSVKVNMSLRNASLQKGVLDPIF
jgi:hypothetical protein